MRVKNLRNETIATIADYLNIDIEKAKLIRNIVRDKMYIPALVKQYSRVEKWINQCYNEPGIVDIKLEILNDILECYGTEAIWLNEWIDNYSQNIGYVYLNTGDTYNPTIVYSTEQRVFFLGCIGDVVETDKRVK